MKQNAVVILFGIFLVGCGESAERTDLRNWQTISPFNGLFSIEIPIGASQRFTHTKDSQKYYGYIGMHSKHRFMTDSFRRLVLTVDVLPSSEFTGKVPDSPVPDNHIDQTVDPNTLKKWHEDFHPETSLFRTLYKDEYRKDYRTKAGSVVRVRVEYWYSEFEVTQQFEDRNAIKRMIGSTRISNEKSPNQAL